MKKLKIMRVVLALLCMVTVFAGCGNMQIIDTTYTFDKAIIRLPNGEIVEGRVESWADFDDGDQLQIRIDGVTYLVHSENVALIAE